MVFLSASGLGVFYVSNIETVPVSGRKRFNVFSPKYEAQMAKALYESTMQQFRGRILPVNHPYSRTVRRVMGRLIRVSGMEDLHWEVYVIKDDSQKNAFVIPGGKVFVFSGILPIADNDDGLAAVLSHEISHTIAHHAAERMSQMLLVVAALWAASLVLGGSGDSGLGRVLMDLVYLRPQSRMQEAEADYIGLMMLAQACYNPQEAPRLWQRMSAAETISPPQFLSTHPAHELRIENLEKW
ncbi:peptidase M48 [Tirmania nivea]|nr:peptidase M48 [Tirmania nivea]